MRKTPIMVTQPFLPPLDEFHSYLKKIWDRKILTNGGPFHQALEAALCEYLGVEYISLFSNGTIALVTALRALDIRGDVITTPFSFVATVHALLWNNINPVFVDIDSKTCNIFSEKIESAITDTTQAIVPVHCYGNPCDTARIKEIAEKNGLKVIYDAAHAFGVRNDGRSLLLDGDLSVLSFHATKVFNTCEGGAIVCHSAKMKAHIDRLKNFGITDEVTVCELGINGKMSEINAALGLLQLRYVDDAIKRRGVINRLYRELLSKTHGIECFTLRSSVTPNFSYFPIFVGPEYPLARDELYEKLKKQNVYTRRYFYPLISQFAMYRAFASAKEENLPVATDVARRVLCLPIYPEMSEADVMEICRIISMI